MGPSEAECPHHPSSVPGIPAHRAWAAASVCGMLSRLTRTAGLILQMGKLRREVGHWFVQPGRDRSPGWLAGFFAVEHVPGARLMLPAFSNLGFRALPLQAST